MSLLDHTTKLIQPADATFERKARQRLDNLTMPRGSLGRLQELAWRIAAMTRSLSPPLESRAVIVMAGDHGVAVEGVSAYPQEVTGQMVRNFASGGAAINVLARRAKARVITVDMGVASDLSDLAAAGKIVSKRTAPGTRNLAAGPAMSRDQALQSIQAGIEVVGEAAEEGLDLLGLGDMGIANTTPSSAVAAALTSRSAREVTGTGTGIDRDALERKTRVIENALELNRPDPNDAVDVLAKVGGFEIGGIAGCVLAAAARRIPVIIDGLISTAGALIARELCPQCADYMIAAHRSVEIGHAAMLDKLGLEPLLDLRMRLGEGTGAALAMHLVDAAAGILTEMATFEEARVSRRREDSK